MRQTEKNYQKLLSAFGENVKNARESKDLRQADMIEYGFSERYMQKIESGKYSPNLYTAHRLAEALGVSVSKLLDI